MPSSICTGLIIPVFFRKGSLGHEPMGTLSISSLMLVKSVFSA